MGKGKALSNTSLNKMDKDERGEAVDAAATTDKDLDDLAATAPGLEQPMLARDDKVSASFPRDRYCSGDSEGGMMRDSAVGGLDEAGTADLELWLDSDPQVSGWGFRCLLLSPVCYNPTKLTPQPPSSGA